FSILAKPLKSVALPIPRRERARMVPMDFNAGLTVPGDDDPESIPAKTYSKRPAWRSKRPRGSCGKVLRIRRRPCVLLANTCCMKSTAALRWKAKSGAAEVQEVSQQ